uniref:Uncharacterized protein n=1 Tax=Pyramimonas obovata TaxID=1411642 RepID=A0A7S0MYD9_9CHLO
MALLRSSPPPILATLPGALLLLSHVVLVASSDMGFEHNWRGGLVLSGVDVVAYHSMDANSLTPVYGKPEFHHILTRSGEEYTFYFSSPENLDLFRSNLTKYIPRNGGYCSWGFANEWRSGECDADQNPFIWEGECEECDCARTGSGDFGIGDKWKWDKHTMGPPAGLTDGWTIYNGQLYFNIWNSYRVWWMSRVEENIARADARWIHYFGSLDAGPLNVGCYPDTWRACAAGQYPANFGRVPPGAINNADTLSPTLSLPSESLADTLSPTLSPPSESLAAIVSSTTTFASLSITAFDDPAFNATFRQAFKAQMAAAAGMNSTDIIIHSITAGSVMVSSTMYFPTNHVCSPQTFHDMLVYNPSTTVFTDATFEAYGEVTATTRIDMYTTPTPPTPIDSPAIDNSAAGVTGQGLVLALSLYAVGIGLAF